MRQPNSHRAVVDIERLRDYCLSPTHPRGRHKARVFAARLGLTADDAEVLRNALLDAARTRNASLREQDRFGDRYMIQFEMEGRAGWARVHSTRIVRRGESFARLVTCYVL